MTYKNAHSKKKKEKSFLAKIYYKQLEILLNRHNFAFPSFSAQIFWAGTALVLCEGFCLL